MYKGKYVLKVEYDFRFDENAPHILPVERIREMFMGEELRQQIADELVDWVFDPEIGKCKVSMMSFDMQKET